MAAFVEACPSFAESWVHYLRSTPAEERTGYADVAELAHHVVSLQRSALVEELPAVFAVAEQTILASDQTARDFVVLGLFGDIQNIVSHSRTSVHAANFTEYLGPASRREWEAIDAKWVAAGAAAEQSNKAPALTVEQFEQTESVQLRRFIEATTRRLPSGRIISTGDVVRFEATQGQ